MGDNDAPPGRSRFGMDLATRLIVATVALVLAATAVVAVVSYLPMRETVLQTRLTAMSFSASQAVGRLEAVVNAAAEDVRLLAGAPASLGALKAEHVEAGPDSRRQLSSLFVAMLQAKPHYLQVRLLDSDGSGQEAVRVDRSGEGGQVREVPYSELQDKGSRAYFQETLKLQPGEIFVSPVELNRERGEIEIPHVPVVRVAAPLATDDGRNVGIVVINIDLRPTFTELLAMGNGEADVYLVNRDGDFLLHPEPARRFGFELGKRYRLQDAFPQLAPLVASGAGSMASEGYNDLSADPAIATTATLLGGQRWVAVVMTAPRSLVLGPAADTLSWVAAASLGVVVLAVALCGVLARSITRPIAQLTRMIERFDRNEMFELPDRGPEEVALLSRAIRRHFEREDLYDAAVDGSTDAMITTDVNGVISAWNAAAEQLYGYSEDEAIGQSAQIIVPADYLVEFSRIQTAASRGEPTAQIETVRITKNGDRLPVALSTSPVRSLDGEIVGSFSISRDLSAQRQADMLLRQAVDASPAAMIMTDDEGRIVLASREVEAMFGYEADELSGGAIEMLLPEQDRVAHPQLRRDFMVSPVRRMMGSGRDLYARHRDGTEFPVEVGLNPVMTAQGPMVLAVVVDITERKRTEAELIARTRELQRSNAELEQFAYVASHDLQEPLRMVYSFCELLKDQYGDKLDGDALEFIDFAVDGARRMRQMIDDLLDYSRVQTDAFLLQPVSADKALDNALLYLSEQIETCNAEIVRGELPVILGNELQITRVFQNIIGNALKFRGNNPPKIEISAECNQDRWVFSVIDHGIGFGPEENEIVFGVFQRLHGRDEYPGTGIGLAICKRIVERHGGDIWADAVPGQGAAFKFTLLSAQGNTATESSERLRGVGLGEANGER